MALRRGFVFVCFMVLLCGCSGNAPAVVPDAPPPRWSPPTPFPPMKLPTPGPSPELPAFLRDRGTQRVPATSPSKTPPPVVAQLQQELLQLELDIQRIRGLDPKEDVAEHFVTKEQLRSRISAVISEEYSPQMARLDELQYWLLRLTPERLTNLRGLAGDLLGTTVAGYYQPSNKALFVLQSGERLDPFSRLTLAHEFVHSLQDQHFDIQSGLEGVIFDADRAMAYQALVEGDAMLASALYMSQNMNHKEIEEFQKQSAVFEGDLDAFPAVLRSQLNFPYTVGTEFVKSLYAQGGFGAVNRSLSDPPSSTEQIMHPQKYLQTPRDEPLQVGVPPLTDTLQVRWQYQETNVLGEFDLLLMLRQNGIGNPEKAVEGWGGGQYDLYENGRDRGGGALVILGTRWDSLKDADEFEVALRESLSTAAQFGQLWTDSTRYFRIERINDRVFYFAGTDRTAVEKAPSAVVQGR